MSTNKKTISFAVGSKYGVRSSKWNVTVSNGDVYINTQNAGGLWHASLHKSGRLHIKLTHKNVTKENSLPVKSHRKDISFDQYPVGMFIVVPDSCLTKAKCPDNTSSEPHYSNEPDYLIDRPLSGGIVEISVIKLHLREFRGEEWPGRRAGTVIQFAFKLDDDYTICILTRHLHAMDVNVHAINSMIDSYVAKFTPILLDSPERRGVVFGETPTGSLIVTEYAID